MPTDQHAATGTCELGRADIRMGGSGFKFFLTPGRGFFGERGEGCAAAMAAAVMRVPSGLADALDRPHFIP